MREECLKQNTGELYVLTWKELQDLLLSKVKQNSMDGVMHIYANLYTVKRNCKKNVSLCSQMIVSVWRNDGMCGNGHTVDTVLCGEGTGWRG